MSEGDAENVNTSDGAAVREWLVSLGLTDAELVSALGDPDVPALVLKLLRSGDGMLSIRDVAERSQVPIDVVREVRLAAGLETVDDDALVYEDPDVEAFTTLKAGLELFSKEELLSFIRVVGSSMNRIAEAANSLFRGDVERPMRTSGASTADIVRTTIEAQSLALSLTSVLRMMMRQHMVQSVERSRRAFAGTSRADLMAPMAVGFVDLVGFTPLSADMDPQQLSEVVARFEAMATDTITALGGRLVKLIGDEVMFVAVEPSDGCRIAEGLLRRFGSDPELTPRGGMAYGPVLARGGDYFGSTVNLAARLVDQAVPGEVLLTADLAAYAPMPVEPGGRRMLKGFADPVAVSSLTP